MDLSGREILNFVRYIIGLLSTVYFNETLKKYGNLKNWISMTED
jgi:hypothetical protein